MRNLKSYQVVNLQGLPQRLVRQTFMPMAVKEHQHLVPRLLPYRRRVPVPMHYQAQLLIQHFQLAQDEQPRRRRRIRSSLRTSRRLRKLRLALRLDFLEST